MKEKHGPRPRLLFVGNFLSGSLAHRHYCEDLSDRLEARGWSILKTSTIARRSLRPLDMVQYTVRNRRRFDVAHVDVFSGAAFVWAEAVCFTLRRLRVPYVLTLRGGNLPSFAKNWPRRTTRLLRSAALITAPSAYLAEHMRPYADDVVVLPNAIACDQLPFTHRTRLRPRLVWLRSFHDTYNPAMAVDVLAELRRTHADATLTMIGHDKGDGSLERARQRARDRGVQDRLEIILGIPKSRVGAHLSDADIFLNTTDIDNTPVSVLEAMAVGLCVVSTDVGGLPYLLANERTALLVPPRDPIRMADAVRRLLDDADLAGRLSDAARAYALDRDWERVLNRWEDIFRSQSVAR